MIQLRSPLDGSLQTRTGFFSVASVGGMPASAIGGTYILEATADLSDGRAAEAQLHGLVRAPGALIPRGYRAELRICVPMAALAALSHHQPNQRSEIGS